MSLDSFYLLIIAIMMARRYLADTTPQPTTLTPCGQYGFRCLDSKSFQICALSGEDDPEPEAIHECREGLVCDEDNPAYCTPIDPMFTTMKMLMQRDVRNADYAELHGGNECPCDCERTTTETTTTEQDFETTDLPVQQEFDCANYGFYPDFNNNTLFWFCDVPLSGQGFYLRHMICGQERVFDPFRHACVLLDTIRNTRKKSTDEKNKKQINLQLGGRHQKFSCCDRAPGRYADDSNCRLYHYCLTKEFAPVDQLTLTCPLGTAYDPYTNKCSCNATYRCMNKRMSETNNDDNNDHNYCGNNKNNINPNNIIEDYPQEVGASDDSGDEKISDDNNIDCQTPMRFRDVSYCDGYLLCYGDQVIEMDCPEYYKFDDNLLECLPERIARCQ